MIHQDIDGVIFRAVDSVDGNSLAVRRFFLTEAQLNRLREEKEEPGGESLFGVWLANLMLLEAPNLRKVLGGGFDEVDGTPYIVTNWVEGETLKEARDAGHLNAGDRAVFETQAKSVIDYLPVGLRGALLLDGDHILVKRNPSGGLEGSFLISPRHYFGAVGGALARTSDQEQSLAGLAAYFPKGGAFATSGIGSVSLAEGGPTLPASELRSVQGTSSAKVLWMVAALTLLLSAAVAWWLLKPGDSPQIAKESSNLAARRVTPPLEEVPKPAPEARAVELPNDLADRTDEVEIAIPEEEQEELVAEVGSDDEPEPEEIAASSSPENRTVSENGETDAAREFGPYEIESLAEMDGKVVTIAGPVIDTASTASGSWWYLDFGGGPKTVYVVFREKEKFPDKTFTDWDRFREKDIRVTGVYSSSGRGKFGSKAELVIESLDAVEVILPPKVYETYEWQEMKAEVGQSEDVLFEATYKNFLARDGAVYLLFEEGLQVAARFQVGGPLSTQAFSKEMKELEGERIRIAAPVSLGPEGKIELVFELTDARQFGAAPQQ